ncbi:MAG: hypothetical protein HY231_23900 [Acidobacteria bacterium]|nr:hypothetical protein [Acidobacteriota bacterium]
MTQEENERRIALIYKRIEEGLTDEESIELEQLQQIADEAVHPILQAQIDALEEFRKAHGISDDL